MASRDNQTLQISLMAFAILVVILAVMTYWFYSTWQSEAARQSVVYSLTNEGAYGERISRLGIPVRTVGMRPATPNPLKLVRLASWLRASRPDIVQTWMYHADLVGGLAALGAGRIPVVWGIRHSRLDPESTKPMTYRVAQACALLSRRLPQSIICNSTAAIESHAAMGYARERMILIPNGIDLATYRADWATRERVRAAAMRPPIHGKRPSEKSSVPSTANQP